MRSLLTPLVQITLGTWLLVALYAIAHDQYIVRLSEEHFTVGHAPVPGVEDPALQAAALAFGASILPGFAFGLALAVVCCEGPWSAVSVRWALRAVGVSLVVTEGASLLVGASTYTTGFSPYSERWVAPSASPEAMAAQSIQLTAYVVGALSAGAAIVWAAVARWIAIRCQGSSGPPGPSDPAVPRSSPPPPAAIPGPEAR
ncbi:MAG: hypothetical protein KTR31_19460 [Myxococcales bacterium]|nr:hypothetical protein [Myxococcales bacterium]